jgi:hypothetical protein
MIWLSNIAHFLLAAPPAKQCTNNGLLTTGIYDNLCDPATGQVQITGLGDILTVIANVIKIAMELAGALAVIFIIVGGIYYVTSTGDPARIKRAKEIVMQAIIGLIVVIVAYALVVYIARAF